ncbi:MAG: B12-binding domain-containing radical SAM protein [Candidatus Sericytochromatia bacterium]|nr:B12-binding domain-containing radical SAM protein [Candidatus Tanganyikabacteria bacterium]
MESLPAGVLAGLTPPDVEIAFYDDRVEDIPFEAPTDLVAISIETFTARRAYQIASTYRRRGVPVVMGGFHATLCPDEVQRYAEAVVVGEAEELWAEVVDDFRHRTPKRIYRGQGRPELFRSSPDRRIFAGKRYLPVGLVETSRGCPFHCEFCAIQAAYCSTQTRRPLEQVIAEVASIKDRSRLFFFVDDNLTGNVREAKDFLRALAPLGIRWVSQGSLNMAQDDELLDLMRRSGCQGLLIGFESLERRNLEAMRKEVNLAERDLAGAIANLHRNRIRIYGTFVFGYGADTAETVQTAVEFAIDQGFYLAAFAQLTPFPGTPLYTRLESEGRLLYDTWWLDPDYSFNQVAFMPERLAPRELERLCVEARRQFYSATSMLRRWFHPVNRSDAFMFRQFMPINWLHRIEVGPRYGHPLGDPRYREPLLESAVREPLLESG